MVFIFNSLLFLSAFLAFLPESLARPDAQYWLEDIWTDQDTQNFIFADSRLEDSSQIPSIKDPDPSIYIHPPDCGYDDTKDKLKPMCSTGRYDAEKKVVGGPVYDCISLWSSLMIALC